MLHIIFLRAENQEKFYLYIIVSVTAGILIFLGLVIGRLLVSRHRAKRDAKFHANNEPLPNGFTDDISEIDADIDLTTPVPVPMQDTRFVPLFLTNTSFTRFCIQKANLKVLITI